MEQETHRNFWSLLELLVLLPSQVRLRNGWPERRVDPFQRKFLKVHAIHQAFSALIYFELETREAWHSERCAVGRPGRKRVKFTTPVLTCQLPSLAFPNPAHPSAAFPVAHFTIPPSGIHRDNGEFLLASPLLVGVAGGGETI